MRKKFFNTRVVEHWDGEGVDALCLSALKEHLDNILNNMLPFLFHSGASVNYLVYIRCVTVFVGLPQLNDSVLF